MRWTEKIAGALVARLFALVVWIFRVSPCLIKPRASHSFVYPCACRDVTCISDTPRRVHVFAGEGLDLPGLPRSLLSAAERRGEGTDNWDARVSHRWLCEGRVSHAPRTTAFMAIHDSIRLRAVW